MKNIVLLAFLYAVMTGTVYAAVPASKKPTLSLQDAIYLAVRSNPNAQISQLSYLSQKFSLQVAEWNFQPHYSFQASVSRTGSRVSGNPAIYGSNWNAQPTVTWLSPIGTQVTLGASNTRAENYHPGLSLQIQQPLLRGFGKAVVQSALSNAYDSERISRLNVEGTLRNTVSAVINAYLDVMMAERIMKIDEDALTRALESVKQTKLYIKAGHKAGNEIVTVKANVASSRTQLENDRNNLLQARYALLTAIGLDPDADVAFQKLDIDGLINKYKVPNVKEVKSEVLKNDIQYQVDDITLHGSTSRALLVAEDNTRWQLNAIATAATGNGSGSGQNAGLNSVFNGTNQSESVALTLQIPIEDQLSKQAFQNAKIALKQAEISFRAERWAKETGAINGWNQVQSARAAQFYAIDAESLQEKTYQVNYQKYLHGLIDSLELQTAQLQLIQSQQTLLNSRIMYLKALVNLDMLMGKTLKTWNVKVRL
jgi:outer membrane protein TolC